MTTASNLAETLLAQLGEDFTVPDVDLTDPAFQLPDQDADPRFAALTEYTIDDLTTGVVGGAGMFDKIMSSNKAHLKEQYDRGHISQADYTAAYVQLTTMSMQSAMDFMIRSRESYWGATVAQFQARRAELEAVTAAVQLEVAKQQLAAQTQQAALLKAQMAVTTLNLSTENAKYDLTLKQIDLVDEQYETQRAQTMNDRSGGATVKGMIGTQKNLYEEQIRSYDRDAKNKYVRMLMDTWITSKSIDEGFPIPGQLNQTNMNEVFRKFRRDLDLN
jgi:hypothetical protein